MSEQWKVGDEVLDFEGDRGVIEGFDLSRPFLDVRVMFADGDCKGESMWVSKDGLTRLEQPKDCDRQDVSAALVADALAIRAGTSIDTATGDQLDRLAELVGIVRGPGESCDVLRRRCVRYGVDLSPLPSVSVEICAANSDESYVMEFEIPVKPRGIDTTPPTRAEAREVVADRLGVDSRYVTDELADTEIERRSAELEGRGRLRLRLTPEQRELAREVAAQRDDEGYLFGRYGGRYPKGSRGGTIHFPQFGAGLGGAYTMNVPPGVDASFLCRDDGWDWFIGWGHGMSGSASSLPAACDGVDEAIRKEMTEKPKREPGAMVYIGTVENNREVIDWTRGSKTPAYRDTFVDKEGNSYSRLSINTLEGAHWVNIGDWIIKGVLGEFYSCDPTVFDQTYELVEE